MATTPHNMTLEGQQLAIHLNRREFRKHITGPLNDVLDHVKWLRKNRNLYALKPLEVSLDATLHIAYFINLHIPQ